MRNKVILNGGYACLFMYSGDSIRNVVVFSSSVLDYTVDSCEKFLPSPKLLAV